MTNRVVRNRSPGMVSRMTCESPVVLRWSPPRPPRPPRGAMLLGEAGSPRKTFFFLKAPHRHLQTSWDSEPSPPLSI